jgi:GMP synthase-like glutamine amidotransferase
MPNALVIQHVAVEESFAIADALVGAGVRVDARLVGRDALPDLGGLREIDALVVMGGPQDAHPERDGDPRSTPFPTRDAELELLQAAVELGIPTLGVCLGAQLLAAAAGGRAVRGHGAEIGWTPVQLMAAASSDSLLGDLPPELVVLSWHGDTVELPPRATLLASNESYTNQAFRVGPRAWGLQFHLEVTVEAVTRFVETFKGDPAIAEQASRHLAILEPARDLVLERFARLV